MEALSEVALDCYLDRLAMDLRQFIKDFGGQTSLTPSVNSDLKNVAASLVFRAQQLGFAGEHDVTAFALMTFAAEKYELVDGIWGWIIAVLNAIEYPTSARMDAIYMLLPSKERTRYFPSPRSLVD
jgi:hypothetical protein